MMEYQPKYVPGDRIIIQSEFSLYNGETGVMILYCSNASLIELDKVTYRDIGGEIKKKRSWVTNHHFRKIVEPST